MPKSSVVAGLLPPADPERPAVIGVVVEEAWLQLSRGVLPGVHGLATVGGKALMAPIANWINVGPARAHDAAAKDSTPGRHIQLRACNRRRNRSAQLSATTTWSRACGKRTITNSPAAETS